MREIEKKYAHLKKAMPKIEKMKNKVFVIKFGGKAMVDGETCRSAMEDAALLKKQGLKVVIVHGGGPEITATMKKMGMEARFVDGLRYTDAETVSVVQMVLAGKINKTLVNFIQQSGENAIGLCGIDGRLLEAECLDEKLGYVGKITKVNAKIIEDCIKAGYMPVISTVGCDAAGNVYNINADTAASEIASAMNAESLVLMTDIKGLMRDKADGGSLIERLNPESAKKLIRDGTISDGMIPKAECCINALEKGVENVFIIDGRAPHSIFSDLLSGEGKFTLFLKGEVV